jgi:hypothetical protein
MMDEETLSKSIASQWNELEVEELAEKIIQLEKRVSLLDSSSPRAETLRKEVEHYHFQFVFPIALEFDLSRCSKSMPRSFAKTIHYMAGRVFKSGSINVFNELNEKQKQEILQLAAGGEG